MKRAREVIEIALSPSSFESVSDWTRALLDETKWLTRADRGSFLLDNGETRRWAAADYSLAAITDYGPRIESVAPEVDIWDRLVRLGVHHRDELWLPIRPGFYKTAYYNEFLRPIRAFDSLGFTWREGADRGAGTFQFLVHSGERGRRFGSRERMLMEVVEPAIRAGTRLALGCSAEPRPTPADRGSPSDAQLREAALRHGLTRRQAEVALLMSRRLTHVEISERLGISTHTVRRHEEAVRSKLGVRSRKEVLAVLSAGGYAPDPSRN